MTDTPLHIKQIQHKIWFSKTPQERLLQFLKDNEQLYISFKKAKTLNDQPTYSKKSK